MTPQTEVPCPGNLREADAWVTTTPNTHTHTTLRAMCSHTLPGLSFPICEQGPGSRRLTQTPGPWPAQPTPAQKELLVESCGHYSRYSRLHLWSKGPQAWPEWKFLRTGPRTCVLDPGHLSSRKTMHVF